MPLSHFSDLPRLDNFNYMPEAISIAKNGACNKVSKIASILQLVESFQRFTNTQEILWFSMRCHIASTLEPRNIIGCFGVDELILFWLKSLHWTIRYMFKKIKYVVWIASFITILHSRLTIQTRLFKSLPLCSHPRDWWPCMMVSVPWNPWFASKNLPVVEGHGQHCKYARVNLTHLFHHASSSSTLAWVRGPGVSSKKSTMAA